MIYEGQGKRRMAKILERRPCVCPKCKPAMTPPEIYPWPAARNVVSPEQVLESIKKKKEA